MAVAAAGPGAPKGLGAGLGPKRKSGKQLPAATAAPDSAAASGGGGGGANSGSGAAVAGSGVRGKAASVPQLPLASRGQQNGGGEGAGGNGSRAGQAPGVEEEEVIEIDVSRAPPAYAPFDLDLLADDLGCDDDDDEGDWESASNASEEVGWGAVGTGVCRAWAA